MWEVFCKIVIVLIQENHMDACVVRILVITPMVHTPTWIHACKLKTK